MTTPSDARRLVMSIWWGMFVPYVALYDTRVGIFPPTRYYESHLPPGLVFIFHIALYFSIAWIVTRLILFRLIRLKTADKLMLGLGIVASALGVRLVLESMAL
jgi:hypothetical protein